MVHQVQHLHSTKQRARIIVGLLQLRTLRCLLLATAIPLQAIGNVLESGTFPVGTSVVTATATDGAGRTASCNVNVIVSQGILQNYYCFAYMQHNVLVPCCFLGFVHLIMNVDLAPG